MAAYSFCCPPQIPIKKYIGSNINSKQIKKSKKSSDKKLPITAQESNKYKKKYKRGRINIFLEKTEAKPPTHKTSAARAIKRILFLSIPKK